MPRTRLVARPSEGLHTQEGRCLGLRQACSQARGFNRYGGRHTVGGYGVGPRARGQRRLADVRQSLTPPANARILLAASFSALLRSGPFPYQSHSQQMLDISSPASEYSPLIVSSMSNSISNSGPALRAASVQNLANRCAAAGVVSPSVSVEMYDTFS